MPYPSFNLNEKFKCIKHFPPTSKIGTELKVTCTDQGKKIACVDLDKKKVEIEVLENSPFIIER
jgi:hypothetical protein